MKRLNLDQLDSWLAVVESGSFRAAAKRLSRSQATVSQHIQRLEAYIGGTLVKRGQRGCGPTPLGKRLVPIARALINGEKQANQLVSLSAPRLGVCSNIGIYLLPPLLASFCAHQPSPPLLIGTNPEITDALEAGILDVGLLECWTPHEDLIAVPWRRERMVAICPPRHSWAGRSHVTISDLCNQTLIGGEAGTGTGRLLREMLSMGIPLPTPAMELGSTEAVKRAVAAGLGVSIVLEMSSHSEIQEGRILAFHLDPDVHKTLWLVRRAEVDPGTALFSYFANAADRGRAKELAARQSVYLSSSPVGNVP